METTKFVSPVAQASSPVINKARDEDKTVMKAEEPEGEKWRKTVKPEETPKGKKKRMMKSETEEKGKARTLERREAGEDTGVPEKKQKSKKRVQEKEMDRGDRAKIGKKMPKLQKTSRDQDGQTVKEKKGKGKEQLTEKSRQKTLRENKAQRLTASKCAQEAELGSSISGLIEDTKVMLTEESVRASIDQKAHRGEQERGKDETDECSTVRSRNAASGKESMKEVKNRAEEREEENSSDSDEYVVWVQCSRPDCSKWRKLSADVDPSFLPDDWTCENNPDPAACRCSDPEEPSCVCEEEMFFCSLVPGSLVWAQQDGHPWWPAMIERDPETEDYLEFQKKTDITPSKCHVTYFEEPVLIDWVPCSNVRNYTDLPEDDVFNMLDQPKLMKKLKDAIHMSRQALKLPLQTRLDVFGFWARYESERESSEEDSDVTEVLKLSRGKGGKYSDDEDLWPKKRERCPKEGEKKQRRRDSNDGEKRGKEMSAEKRKEKTKRENGKTVKKIKVKNENKVGESARNSEEGGLKVTKQKEKLEKCFCPLFSLPKKNKPAHKTDAAKKEVFDQKVPENTMEATPDTRQTKGAAKFEVNEEERDENEREEKERTQKTRDEEEGREGTGQKMNERQNRWKESEWVDAFSDGEEVFPEDEEDGEDEDDVLASHMEILSCRRKYLKGEEEEEGEEEDPTNFSLMLLEEE